MAEVALPRALFRSILDRIAGLRPPRPGPMLTLAERAGEVNGGSRRARRAAPIGRNAIGRGAQSPWRAVKRVLPPGRSQKPLALEIARAVSRLRDGMGFVDLGNVG